VASDLFSKVKKMIKDLIVRLMEEANEETEHKGWCDTELGTNAHTRKEKTQAVEQLHAEIDEFGASVIKLSEEITELSGSMADLDRAMAEATQIRTVEKAKNSGTLQDAQQAQEAVERAVMVLEFYAKAGDATGLMQMQMRQEPQGTSMENLMQQPYKGMAAKGRVNQIHTYMQIFSKKYVTSHNVAVANAKLTIPEFLKTGFSVYDISSNGFVTILWSFMNPSRLPPLVLLIKSPPKSQFWSASRVPQECLNWLCL